MNAMQLQQLENPSVSTRMRVAAETTHSGALLHGARPAHGAIIRRLAGMKPVERGKNQAGFISVDSKQVQSCTLRVIWPYKMST